LFPKQPGRGILAASARGVESFARSASAPGDCDIKHGQYRIATLSDVYRPHWTAWDAKADGRAGFSFAERTPLKSRMFIIAPPRHYWRRKRALSGLRRAFLASLNRRTLCAVFCF
jgi:hypothetical protein